MEITCQQCGTIFSVDVDQTRDDNREVVCPGCFQFHILPPPVATPVVLEAPPGLEPAHESPLGDGGLGERLREGFTLQLELRSPNWANNRRQTPFEIRQLIYEGKLDGTEEFREKAGKWYPVGGHPDFAMVFRLVGVTIALQAGEVEHKKITGWRNLQAPERLAPSPILPLAAPVPVVVEAESVFVSHRLTILGVGIVLIVGLLALVLFLTLG